MFNNSISEKDQITSPNDIPGLQFHLDASVGVYDVSNNDISTTNGAQLNRWDDQAKNVFQTNGFPLCALRTQSTQTTITNYQNWDPTGTGFILTSYPKISTNAINGKNAIYFDGYSGMQILNSLSSINFFNVLTRGRTFFIVYRQLPDPWTVSSLGLMYCSNFTLRVFPGSYPTIYNRWHVGGYETAYNPLLAASTNGNWNFQIPSLSAGNVWRILICNQRRYGNTNTAYVEMFLNGVMRQAGYDGIRPADGQTSDNNISINGNSYVNIACKDVGLGYGDGYGGFNGLIAECGMYFKPRGLSRMEVNQLTAHLKNKYNIA